MAVNTIDKLQFLSFIVCTIARNSCNVTIINSEDDVDTSCKNVVNFCLVNPEISELIFVHVAVFGENRPTHLHSSCRHSETPWSIGTLMGALRTAMIRLKLS